MGSGRGQGRGKGAFSGYSCVKYMFFAFNVIFWLLGSALLGVGIWLHVSKGAYASIAPTYNFLSVTAIIIAAGCIMIVVGFFGCCGAIMENQCMLIIYFILVVIIFVLEIVAGILAFVYRDDLEGGITAELTKGIRSNYKVEDGLTKAWDSAQSDLQCCGVVNYTDWYRSAAWPNHDYVPESCCLFKAPTCGESGDASQWHKKGCYEEIKGKILDNLYIVGIIGITIGIIQILGLVASMALTCFLRSEKYQDYYT